MATLPLDEVFRGRSVFVTGHTGFKGSWLVTWLHRLSARVTGYALPPAGRPNPYDAVGVGPLLADQDQADVRDAERLAAAVDRADPDVIFHLAARALVRESYQQPRDFFDVNVMGTVNLLEHVRRRGRPCAVVVVTSDKCYENREHTWGYRECDPLGGADPYSASKAACEVAVGSYRQSFFPPEQLARHGVKLASARAGNVIGGGDWGRERIVPDMVRSLAAGQPIPVRNPRAVRPWQHVLEPLSGYLLLAARMLTSDDPSLCGGWNFGPPTGTEYRVAELADHFCRAWGKGSWFDASQPGAPHEAHLLRLSIDKAQSELGWRPRWSLKKTVERTARWYRRFCDGASPSMQPACLEDIHAYEHTPSED
jgi:CDP-glucose 4,6-dehydratase